MSRANAIATSVGGRFLLLGCSDGLKAYHLHPKCPVRKLIPGVGETLTTRGCHAVGGSVGVVAVLGETPLIAFVLSGDMESKTTSVAVGGGDLAVADVKPDGKRKGSVSSNCASMSTSRVLYLYDLDMNQTLAELHFETTVVGVKMNTKRLVVALAERIHVLDLRTLAYLAELRTTSPINPDGILVLSDPTTNSRGDAISYVAFPQSDHREGDVWVSQIREEQMDHGEQGANVTHALIGNRCGLVERVSIVKAHQCAVVCLAMTRDGTRLATSSERGTTVKVFEPASARLMYLFRRGIMPARMLSLSFGPSSDLSGLQLASLSSRGTLHLFRCIPSGGNELVAPTPTVFPYRGTEARSFAQVTVGNGTSVATQPSLLMRGSDLKKVVEAHSCFFSDNGQFMWVVLPSPCTVRDEEACTQPCSSGDSPLESVVAATETADTFCWVAQLYAIHANGCELVRSHVLN